jgi:hypothetical protein
MGGFLPHKYIYCATQPMHARKYCPRINLRCFDCMHRGHAEVDNVCLDVDINLALFEDLADVGWVTRDLYWISFPSSPFRRFATLRTREDIRACWPCRYQIVLHTKWVGAEPYFTQAVARKGYLMATYDAEYAAYVGGIMQEGGRHRQRKVRTAVNLQARFCPADEDGVPWGEQMDYSAQVGHPA